MVTLIHLFIFAIVASTVRASPETLLPKLTQTTRNITQRVSETSGDLLANLINSLVAVPIATSKTLNRLSLHTLISDMNIVDQLGFLIDFTAGSRNEDARLNFEELIVKYGFPVERHRVVTEDGYILTLFRIPGNGSVAFLMHGLLSSADDYLLSGPENSLAYLLAKEGYDVWLGNARGNKHSRRHITHKPSEAVFWDFSWHEIGYHDLPAMIDYVLNATEQQSLKYVGHSQGTTSFFVMASERPEYNEKISLMVALSPVAFMSHMRSPVKLLTPTNALTHKLLKSFGVHELLPDDSFIRTAKQVLCGTGRVAEILCSNVLFLFMGFGFEQLNVMNLPVIYGHIPSGASVKQLIHYLQEIVSAEFRQFDYGVRGNKLKYGSRVPPNYELSNIKAPVALFYSEGDWMSHPTDVDELYGKLSNVVDRYKIPTKRFNHLDFLWAKDYYNLIFKRLRKLFSRY